MSDTALPVIVRFDTTANRLAFTPSPGVPEQLYVWLDSDDQPNAYYWDGANWQAFNGASGGGNVNAGGTLTNNALVIGQGSTDVATTTTGTGILTALGINVGSAGAPVVFNGAGGTPSSLTLTNATGLPVAGGGTGLSSFTAGDLLYATGATTLVKLGIGTAGDVLTVNAGATAPEWDAPSGGGGGLVLLEQHTASSSATLDFTTFYSSSYDDYQIECVNVAPNTNGVSLRLRVSTDGGMTWDSSSNYYYGWSFAPNFGSIGITQTGAGNDTSLDVIGTVDTGAGVCGTVKLYNPGSASLTKAFLLSLFGGNSSALYGTSGAGLWNQTTAVNAIQFYFSSGNITSGTIRVYGLSK